MEAFIQLTKQMSGFEHIAEKLENSTARFYDRVYNAYNADWPSFTALCQNELCHNRQCTMNIMFQSDSNGKLTDAIQTEYPFICYGSVVNEIANGFYMSSSDKLRSDDWDELLQYYHSELITTLKKLNYSDRLPTLTELQVQLTQRGIGNVAIGMFEFAERFYEGPLNNGLFETITKDPKESIRRRFEIIKSASNSDELQYMLNYFDRRGYFDV